MDELLHPAQLWAIEKLGALKVGALYVERQEGKLRVVSELIRYRFQRQKIDRVVWLCTRRKMDRIEAGCARYLVEFRNVIFLCGLESLSHDLGLFLRTLDFCSGGRVMTVIDNSLLIKNPNALRTKRATEISLKSKYRLLVSDVPLVNRASDMFSQWYALDWRILGYQSYWGFCLNHVRGTRSLHMDYLSRAIIPYSAQILREEVQSVAGRKEYVWKFQLSAEIMAHYKEVSRRFMWKAQQSSMGVYRMFQACRRIASGQRVLQDYPLTTEPFSQKRSENARFQALLEVLKHFPNQNALILCHYRFEVETVKEGLAERFGADSVQPYRNRKKNAPRLYTVMNLQADEWETARLQANVIIYYSSNWNWKKRHEKERQCQNALVDGKITVVSLVAADTIEMQILRCVWKKDHLICQLRRELTQQTEEQSNHAQNIQESKRAGRGF